MSDELTEAAAPAAEAPAPAIEIRDYLYDAQANPNQAHIPGVPLDNITADQFAAYPEPVQRSIAAAPFYV